VQVVSVFVDITFKDMVFYWKKYNKTTSMHALRAE
jgi:hypothetical protein